MTRARNIAGFSTITTTPSPIHVGPIGVLTATRIDGEFNQVDLNTRELTAQGIGVTNLQVSGITTGLNVSGIITAQNGINFNGTSTGLNASGIGTIATLNVTGNATIAGVLTYEDVTNVDSVGVVTARGLSIFGNTTGLNVASGISTFQDITAANSTVTADLSIADKIVHTGDANTAIRFPSADTIQLETGGSVRTHIHSDGRFRVGCTAQPSATVGGFQLDMGSYPGSMRLSQGGGTSGTDGAGINVYGGNNGTGIGAAAAMGAVLNLVNTNNTDNNQTSVDFSNSNSLSIAKVIGKNDSHSSRTGSLIFSTSNAAAPTESMRITGDGMVLMGTTTEGHSSADDLTIATSGNTGITLRSGTSSAGNIYFSDATSGSGEYIGYISYSHSNNNLSFGAGDGSEKLRITSDGHLVIGGDSNNTYAGLQRLDIFNTSTADDYHGSLIRLITKNVAGNSTSSYDIVKYKEGTVSHNNNESGGSINFYAGGATRLQVLSTGNINVNDGDIVFASGHGIDFSATGDGSGTDTSEVLDDYEEGTWTITVNNGFSGISYVIQRGWYTRIGVLVHASFFLRFSAAGASTHMRFSGLPYVSADLSPAYSSGGNVNYTNIPGIDSSSNVGNQSIWIGTNSSIFELYSNGNSSSATGSGGFSDKDIYGHITYRVG